MTANIQSPFLTIIEAAAYLRVSRSSIYTLFKSGAIRKTKIGGRSVVSRSALEEYAAAAIASE